MFASTGNGKNVAITWTLSVYRKPTEKQIISIRQDDKQKLQTH